MPAAPPNLSSQTRRGGLGVCTRKPAVKPGYCPELDLTGDHPCAPNLSQVFHPSNAGLWSEWPPAPSPGTCEHRDFFSAWEHPSSVQHHPTAGSDLPAEGEMPAMEGGTTHAELSRLSARAYSLRVSDPSDFASVWETSVVPLLVDLLQRHCPCDYAVDVHNFPELAGGGNVPRAIYVTLSPDGDTDTALLEQTIRDELRSVLPERFGPVSLRFRRGAVVRKSTCWWGREPGEKDLVCEPKNVSYRPTPVVGMSIGPVRTHDAASLGGFIRVGSELYAMSAFHPFEESMRAFRLRVSHPAVPDLPLLVPANPRARPYNIGTVAMGAPPGTFRPSLTFDGLRIRHDTTMVEMDWSLIGPVPEGKNFVSVPSYQMDRCVAVQATARVEGNTEVYALARTSGYSLGFTSDAPGLLRISGKLRREWTVRQYAPFRGPMDGQADARWQTLKQWVTSGIGVPGDSGAWLIRRSDNALMGLIWGRNHDCGNPLERIRLTYFTPIVDILADIRENHADGEEVGLPSYSERDLTREVEVRSQSDVVSLDASLDPWTVFAMEEVSRHSRAERRRLHRLVPDLRTIPSRRDGGPSPLLPATGDRLLRGLERDPSPVLSLPELSTLSSVRSGYSALIEVPEVASAGLDVRIFGDIEVPEDILDMEEPVRAKATFASGYPEVLRFDHVVGAS